MTVEIRQARYFVAVAEELHFGRAAERLQMSQPPLSQAIQQLERAVGVELLQRTKRSVALTSPGAVFLGECRRLIRQAEDAEIAVRQAASGGAGLLRIGAVPTAFTWPLPLLFERFRDSHPGVEVRVSEIDSHEAAAGLLDRSLDWAIVRQTGPVKGTAATRLFADRFVAALPTEHPASRSRSPIDLLDLSGDTWIWLPRNISPDYHDAMAAACRANGFSPVPTHWARSVTSQVAMVACGLGVSIVPSAAATPDTPAVFRPLLRGTMTIELAALTRAAPEPLAEELTAIALGAIAERSPTRQGHDEAHR